ncbi:MAG: glycosyltransferase [Bacteroidales bacterium]|nr:glycosyltransferase [Bacteroidales bacterium]
MNSQSVIISIIIPVYNVEKYLSKCLDSVISQTYKQLEIIVIDDGSTDKSGIICDEFALKDNRIIVIHQPNGGLSAARNSGLDIAKGEYVMFVDSDDFVESTFCEKPLNIALKENVDIVTFGYFKISNKSTKVNRTNNPRIVQASEAIKLSITLDDVIHGFVWNKFYRRNLFDEIRFPVGRTFEDQGVNYLLYHFARNIYISDEALYHYCRRDNSISKQYYTPRSIKDRFEIWSNRLIFIQKNYPELGSYQIQQLVNESFLAFTYVSSLPQYKSFIKKVDGFLIENKKNILQIEKDKKKKLLLFYYSRPLFHLFYYRISKKYWNSRIENIL